MEIFATIENENENGSPSFERELLDVGMSGCNKMPLKKGKNNNLIEYKFNALKFDSTSYNSEVFLFFYKKYTNVSCIFYVFFIRKKNSSSWWLSIENAKKKQSIRFSTAKARLQCTWTQEKPRASPILKYLFLYFIVL